jgi:hypothetical protein
VVLTAVLPLPRLGLIEALLPQLEIPGSGLWVDDPHRVIAFGLLYFAVLSWSKWKLAALTTATRPTLRS